MNTEKEGLLGEKECGKENRINYFHSRLHDTAKGGKDKKEMVKSKPACAPFTTEHKHSTLSHTHTQQKKKTIIGGERINNDNNKSRSRAHASEEGEGVKERSTQRRGRETHLPERTAKQPNKHARLYEGQSEALRFRQAHCIG